MNEQEFRRRLYSDPYNPGEELLRLGEENAKLGRILEQTRAQNRVLDETFNAVAAPQHLRYRLLRIPDSAGTSPGAEDNGNRFLNWLTVNIRPLTLACSVALVVGLTVGMLIGRDSTMAEQTFGQQIVMHLSHEVPELQGITEGTVNTEFNLAEINTILGNAGSRLQSDGFQAMAPVRYAKNCIIDPVHKSAHLILQTDNAAINVIVMNNTPVRRQFQFGNDRFSGIVLPMSGGNLILVAEKNIDLEYYNEIIAGSVEWNI